MEIILFKGDMATLFLSRDSADAAIKSGQYRKTAVSLSAAVPAKPVSEKPDGAIAINSASLTELQTIDGIGIARAREIIENRPYSTVEDLIQVTEAVDWVELEKAHKIWIGG